MADPAFMIFFMGWNMTVKDHLRGVTNKQIISKELKSINFINSMHHEDWSINIYIDQYKIFSYYSTDPFIIFLLKQSANMENLLSECDGDI